MKEIEANEVPSRELFWRSGHYKALRIGDMKMQITKVLNRIWYHNLIQDPYEYDNLAKSVFNIISQDEIQQLHLDSSHFVSFAYSIHGSHMSTLLTMMVSHYARLLQVDGEQEKPLWEAVLEVPHCIDRSMSKIQKRCGLDEEWMIWPNLIIS